MKQIPNFSKYCVTKNGIIYNQESKKLKPQRVQGYLSVVIKDDYGKSKRMAVHRLVYMTYVGEIAEGLVINHIDGVRDNNSLKNLEAVTISQNNKHRYGGKYNKPANLKPERFAAINKLKELGWTIIEIAKAFEISRASVYSSLKTSAKKHYVPKTISR